MSRDRGNRAAGWVAEYLLPWYPHAEKTPNGRPGADLTGTPGVAFEVKTGTPWRNQWLEQAAGYAAPGTLAVLVYLPPGTGRRSVGNAQAYLPAGGLLVPAAAEHQAGRGRRYVLMHVLMPLLTGAGYAPAPANWKEEKTA